MKLPTLDQLDREILRSIHIDGRTPWSAVAAELGSSVSTVRRRFEAMQASGLVRVIGRTDVTRLGLGIATMVQLRGQNSSSKELALALQQREDVRYVSATVGSAGCIAEFVCRSLYELHTAIDDVARRFDVLVEPFVVTHTYTSGQDWLPGAATRDIQVHEPKQAEPLTDEERIVLGMLLRDGRTSLSDLAVPLGKSESTARRTLESMQERGLVSYRVLVEPRTLGFSTEFWLWLYVDPKHLTEVGKKLASLPSTKTLFASSGRHNMIGQFVLQDHMDLHAFSTDLLGSLSGIHNAEIMLQSANYKRVWNIVDGQYYSGVLGPEWLFSTAALGITQ